MSSSDSKDHSKTADTVLIFSRGDGVPRISTPRYRVVVTSGADVGKEADAVDGKLTIGTAPGVDLPLSDPTVSQFHVELAATDKGISVRDLCSTNGTWLGGVRVGTVLVRSPIELKIGRTVVGLHLGSDRATLETTAATSFGSLIGESAAMRAVYTVLERASPTNAPILLTGESGTGKELAAHAVHEASSRCDGPFEVVDCGGIPPLLIESELFGHERGSFTGATARHEGAFERADGGTLFIDELGELPLELQPKLLRALGERAYRRIGARSTQRADVRIIAATNRDLRQEVNSGRFRADLFYRIAVIQVPMPPLRDRMEDLPLLARTLLDAIAREHEIPHQDIELDSILPSLLEHPWPGNVRELRNYLENLLILRIPPAFEADTDTERGGDLGWLEHVPMRIARARFEQRYVRLLLERTGGNVAEAAKRADVARATMFRLISRHGIKREAR